LVKRETPDSEPMYFELKSDVYEKIAPPQMALSFYDTKIESFNPFEAFKLELLRGTPKDQEKFLLEKDDKDKKDKDKKEEPKKDEPKGDKDTKKTDKETKKDEKEAKKDDKEAKKDEDAKKSDWKLIEPKGFEGKGAGAD